MSFCADLQRLQLFGKVKRTFFFSFSSSFCFGHGSSWLCLLKGSCRSLSFFGRSYALLLLLLLSDMLLIKGIWIKPMQMRPQAVFVGFRCLWFFVAAARVSYFECLSFHHSRCRPPAYCTVKLATPTYATCKSLTIKICQLALEPRVANRRQLAYRSDSLLYSLRVLADKVLATQIMKLLRGTSKKKKKEEGAAKKKQCQRKVFRAVHQARQTHILNTKGYAWALPSPSARSLVYASHNDIDETLEIYCVPFSLSQDKATPAHVPCFFFVILCSSEYVKFFMQYVTSYQTNLYICI